MSTTAKQTETVKDLEGKIATYYGKGATSNYERLFGDNRHLGYFPHLKDPSKPVLSFEESTAALTMHMAEIAGIDSNSRVIDFGCGAGQPLYEICKSTGCQVELNVIWINALCCFLLMTFEVSIVSKNTVNHN